MKSSGTNSYKRFYSDLNFDRAGLFEFIKNKYDCSTALYPGCSIHITPSFFFQHVVYVDISATAREFFQDTQKIAGIVNSNKKYKTSAYFQFINQDYTQQLPVRENNYDLLIAIYAGGITKSCQKYINHGGIIVSNNHHNDVLDALADSSVRLEALIRRKGKKYQLEKMSDEQLLAALQKHRIPSKNMRNSNGGIEFVDNDDYFVCRKV